MFLVGNFFIIVSGDICSIDNNFEVSGLCIQRLFFLEWLWYWGHIFVIKMNINFLFLQMKLS